MPFYSVCNVLISYSLPLLREDTAVSYLYVWATRLVRKTWRGWSQLRMTGRKNWGRLLQITDWNSRSYTLHTATSTITITIVRTIICECFLPKRRVLRRMQMSLWLRLLHWQRTCSSNWTRSWPLTRSKVDVSGLWWSLGCFRKIKQINNLRALSVCSRRTKAGKHHNTCSANTNGSSTGRAWEESFTGEREQVQTD